MGPQTLGDFLAIDHMILSVAQGKIGPQYYIYMLAERRLQAGRESRLVAGTGPLSRNTRDLHRTFPPDIEKGPRKPDP